jgi:FkbM family methyltransferase
MGISYFNKPTNNDQWVVDLFRQKRGGYFVEAGALDGIHGSCTYTLEKFFAWTGLLVEPGPPFPALVVNRPGSRCENVCISDRDGRVSFVIASDRGYSGIKEKLQQKDRNHRERWGKPKNEWEAPGYQETEIAAITFYNLLKKHNAPQTIEYVAFDMEGAEYDALKDFPFAEYRILAFSIEGDSCNELLAANGYRQVKNPFNTEAPWESYFLHRSF